MEELPLLQALKEHGEPYNVKYSLYLPTATPYGNLTLTYMEIVTRLDCLNDLITSLYKEFHNHIELVKVRGGWSHPNETFKSKFQIEQVIYWLRKTADEFISIISLLKDYASDGVFPNKIKLSSIGRLLKFDGELDASLTKHIRLLTILNEISNGFKHSLINAQTNAHHGLYEPVVFALVAFNDATNVPTYHQRSLAAVLQAYNEFLVDAREILKLKYQTQ